VPAVRLIKRALLLCQESDGACVPGSGFTSYDSGSQWPGSISSPIIVNSFDAISNAMYSCLLGSCATLSSGACGIANVVASYAFFVGGSWVDVVGGQDLTLQLTMPTISGCSATPTPSRSPTPTTTSTVSKTTSATPSLTASSSSSTTGMPLALHTVSVVTCRVVCTRAFDGGGFGDAAMQGVCR
jgi:hypothetical protein